MVAVLQSAGAAGISTAVSAAIGKSKTYQHLINHSVTFKVILGKPIIIGNHRP